MKHIKTYKIFESSQIWDLEDICQEIKDEGFNVLIRGVEWGKAPTSLGEAKVEIHKSKFTMVKSLSDFLFRLRDWARGEGYEIYARSNYGILNIMDDGRIGATGCTCSPRYPAFTMLEINFAK
jgi:hypothetical protein